MDMEEELITLSKQVPASSPLVAQLKAVRMLIHDRTTPLDPVVVDFKVRMRYADDFSKAFSE